MSFYDDPDEGDPDDDMRTDVADPATLRVRLCETRCDTCIFRPGNLMSLAPGRVKGMVDACAEEEGHVVCHDTLTYSGNEGVPGAVCRGWEQHPRAERSFAVRWMKMTGLATLVNPKTGEMRDVDYNALPPYTEDDTAG